MLYLLFFIFVAILYILTLKKGFKFIFVNFKKYIIMLSLLALIISLIIFSNSSYCVAQNAFMLWVNNIIPSLLPFFICIELLKQTPFINIIGKLLTPIMRPIFNVPGSGAFPLAMGISSGYPTGAKITSELYKSNEFTKVEAERLIAFTNTSGPLFIVGAVGIGMFNSQRIGLLLLLTHFFGSLTCRISL